MIKVGFFFVFGFFLIGIFIVFCIKGVFFILIFMISFFGWIIGVVFWFESFFLMFDISYIFMKMDFYGFLNVGVLGVVFVFFMVDFFDMFGIVIGLSVKVGFLIEDGKVFDVEKVFLIDVIGMIFGVVFGILMVIIYIESVVGIEEGGRIGMMVFVIGFFFFCDRFFYSFFGWSNFCFCNSFGFCYSWLLYVYCF